MLKLVTKCRELDFSRLAAVYEENIRDLGEFYNDTCDFLSRPETAYAIWIEDDQYVAALRIEPYKDGSLIAGLETAPSLRCRGHAKALLLEVVTYFSGKKLYSHVSMKNAASLAVHRACGFEKFHDGAILLDGSACSNFVTLCNNKNGADT